MSASRATHTLRHVHTGAKVTTLTLATVGAALPLSMTAPTLALTAERFGTTAAESSWTLTSTLIVAAITAPTIGRLGDTFGSRRVLRLLIPVLLVGLAITGLASSLETLIAGRVLVGLGGGVLPLAISIATHIAPPHRRALLVGILASAFATGTALGVVVSGLLVETLGTQALSWVPFGMLAAAEVLALMLLPRVAPTAGHRLDLVGPLLLAGGVAGLLLAITEAPRMPYPELATAACALAGATLLLVWAWRATRRRRADDTTVSLRARPIWSSHLVALLLGATLFATFVVLPIFIELTRTGETNSPLVAGLILLPATLAMAAVGPLAGVFRRLLGRRGPAVLGAAATAVGAVILAASSHSLPALLTGSIVAGAGIATASAGVLNILIDASPDPEVAAVSGVNVLARQVGGAFGAAGAASLVALGGDDPAASSFSLAFTFLCLVAAGAFAASLLLPRGATLDE
ncbi:MFS transporter [Microbacterium sediminicola]|uniref:MFS transporter n=1 Tax=Microbacterium sediminicola TaxID=415210 RepID=A0ABN2HZ77_9MICO